MRSAATRTLSLTALVALAFNLSGCALLRRLLAETATEPRVVFEEARISNASLDGETLTLLYTVENDTAFEVDVTKADLTLTVDGKPVPLKETPRAQTVLSGRKAQLAFVADLDLSQAVAAKATSLHYRATGAVTLMTPIGLSQIPLEQQGPVPVPQPPVVGFSLPRISSLSLAGATIELPVTVENPNAFPLSSLAFTGGLEIAGLRVASLADAALGPLGANERKTVGLPLQFGLPTLASGAAKSSAPVAIAGAVTSGKVSVPVRWADTLKLPTLAFSRVAVGQVNFEGATINLVFNADNPNDLAVELGDLKSNLLLDGRKVATVAPTAPRLEPKMQGELTVPLQLRFADLGAGLITLLQKGTARFHADGALALPTLAGTQKLPVSQDGTLELPKIPKVTFAAPKLTNLTFTTATLELPLEVTNANGFAVPINAVTGALSIAGAKVGTLNSGALGELPAGGSKKLSLPLSFELLKFAGAATALKSGSAPLAFDGTIDAAGLKLPVKWAETVNVQR